MKIEDQNVLIFTDSIILKNILNKEALKKEPCKKFNLFFFFENLSLVKGKANTCFIAQNQESLLNWYDQGGIYGLLKNDLRYDDIISFMLKDKSYSLMLKKTLLDIKAGENLKVPLHFSIRCFSHCDDLVSILETILSSHTKKDCSIGIHELLINGIEHGNLSINRDEKESFWKNGTIVRQISNRLNHPIYGSRYVDVKIDKISDKGKKAIIITIKDQGAGFNWRNQQLSTQLFLGGRGLSIAKGLSFDNVIYNDIGNEVECYIHCD